MCQASKCQASMCQASMCQASICQATIFLRKLHERLTLLTEWQDQKFHSRPIPRLFFETKYSWDRYRDLFLIPNVFETNIETFFETKYFSRPILRLFFRDQICRDRYRNSQKNEKSLDTEKSWDEMSHSVGRRNNKSEMWNSEKLTGLSNKNLNHSLKSSNPTKKLTIISKSNISEWQEHVRDRASWWSVGNGPFATKLVGASSSFHKQQQHMWRDGEAAWQGEARTRSRQWRN